MPDLTPDLSTMVRELRDEVGHEYDSLVKSASRHFTDDALSRDPEPMTDTQMEAAVKFIIGDPSWPT